MVSRNVIASDYMNRHDNPFGKLVQTACSFDCGIHLQMDNRKINAKSIMGVMTFAIQDGSAVTIVADGVDENSAVEAISDFLTR